MNDCVAPTFHHFFRRGRRPQERTRTKPPAPTLGTVGSDRTGPGPWDLTRSKQCRAPKGNEKVFQPSVFRGEHVSFRESIFFDEIWVDSCRTCLGMNIYCFVLLQGSLGMGKTPMNTHIFWAWPPPRMPVTFFPLWLLVPSVLDVLPPVNRSVQRSRNNLETLNHKVSSQKYLLKELWPTFLDKDKWLFPTRFWRCPWDNHRHPVNNFGYNDECTEYRRCYRFETNANKSKNHRCKEHPVNPQQVWIVGQYDLYKSEMLLTGHFSVM